MAIFPQIPEHVGAENTNYWESLMIPRLRGHFIGVNQLGDLPDDGPFVTSRSDIDRIFAEGMPRLTAEWKKPIKIVFYAHGGLIDEKPALTNLWNVRNALISKQIYPIFFLWQTSIKAKLLDMWNVLLGKQKGSLKHGEDITEVTDAAIEALIRSGLLGVRSFWEDLKKKAIAASDKGSAARAIDSLKSFLREEDYSVHLIGHSAGSNFHVYFCNKLIERGIPIGTCTLWGPSCSIVDAENSYLKHLAKGGLKRLALYTLTDEAEREDDCLFYRKSILYLVSNALEAPGNTELFGLSKDILVNTEILNLFKNGKADWIISPNSAQVDQPLMMSNCSTHGGFDDDIATVKSSIERILIS